jgi:hypothetical protein
LNPLNEIMRFFSEMLNPESEWLIEEESQVVKEYSAAARRANTKRTITKRVEPDLIPFCAPDLGERPEALVACCSIWHAAGGSCG